ncbi:exonuclease subunit SbcC [Spirulina sp. CS-785/01]|uniref:exonuclease subunit SbcC n=1 Tax=Spirulina sp. CS-785/01 TaxID=3021716 RepID=UPI002330FDB9|nr:exonuclease subunit SbcC [Spirulina sp. CS-785/01]MDB9313132.1 exonuclease subunit SbcC [Spirulina sp. CS-785/01]
MIPLQLRLHNFLSYRDVVLDFQGLHTACICGPNGAGKSSLLEGMTWAIWGQSRVASDDDIITSGEKSVRVDFTLQSQGQIYRIIRSRQQGRSPSLEFQVQTEQGLFRTISEKGVKATQKRIIQTLKLDYDTFLNSAYLRQGRADEFMLRKATERKKILADLLKLDQYETLSGQAKDKAKEFKGKLEQLEQSLTPLQAQLDSQPSLEEEQGKLVQEKTQLQERQAAKTQQLQALQTAQHDRTSWEEKLRWQQNQSRNLTQDCDRINQAITRCHQDKQHLEHLLRQAEDIQTRYQELQQLQQREKSFADKLHTYQTLQEQLATAQQNLTQERYKITQDQNRLQTELRQLQRQEEENQTFLAKAPEIEANFAKLQQYRQRVQDLDRLQVQVAPLQKQRTTLLAEIGQTQAQLKARLDQLHSHKTTLSSILDQVPQWRKEVLEIDQQVQALDKKKVYQKRVQDKGQDKRTEKERLEEQQRTFDRTLREIQQKLDLLQQPGAVCPLCDRALDDHYRTHVISKTHREQEDLHQEKWIIQEQIAGCEGELKKLRQEYQQISDELKRYESLLQERGQLEAQLERSGDDYERLQEIQTEISELEESIRTGNYALELHQQLQTLDQQIADLNYDEQKHALMREEERRLGKAEKQQALLEETQRRQKQLQARKPPLETQLKATETALSRLNEDSPQQQEIAALEQQIRDLGYDRSQHQSLRDQLQRPQVQQWQEQYYQLQQAQQQLPQVEAKLREWQTLHQQREQDKQQVEQELRELEQKMQDIPDYQAEIQRLDREIQQQRQQLDRLIGEEGRLQQRLSHLAETKTRYEQTQEQVQSLRRQHRIYQELAQAFGKNGIQALMIENILPQLEAETNQILARLTGNQLHVQFVTQKAKKSASKKKNDKMIDTLEILIADAQGTRAYETYSGGESFRINFAIRLALAKLLAQRSGASLQMLIVDEGFGTQDAEGCDRLIAAINAIASDFACILTVTHMPQFKEAFQHRIEVRKTEEGSKLTLLV